MLHKINLLACTDHLDWIVQLQKDLLHALCGDAVADDITAEWVYALRSDIDAGWMARFCGWKKSNKSMLQRMEAVAGLPAADKHAVIEHYAANLQFPDAFDDEKVNPPPTTSLPSGISDTAVAAYRDFFEMFYDPIFYRSSTHQGYPVAGGELTQRFSKEVYLDAYHTANREMKVCPLCDGAMDGAELDHWLPKQHLPELNCHPLNLIEICGACNGVTNKGKKLTFDDGQSNPFEDWFHPYFRPVEDLKIRIVSGKPNLTSDHAPIQSRLHKLDWLINLSQRWEREYRIRMKSIRLELKSEILAARRRGDCVHEAWGLHGVLSWLAEYKEKAREKIGHDYYKRLEVALLDDQVKEGSGFVNDLCEYAQEWLGYAAD